MGIFSVRLSEEESKILQQLAERMELTRSDVIRMSLRLLHLIVMSDEPIEEKHRLIEKLAKRNILQKKEIEV
ncbi:MAG: ribbon-helix-helix protein, CopG family [Candidatus Njordarchaeia archaeon]